MTVNDMYLDKIQDEQDRNLWQRQFVKCNYPKSPKTVYDFYGTEITPDEEVWMTDDGLVVIHNLVEYCKDKYGAQICDVDMAIETVEDNGGYEI